MTIHGVCTLPQGQLDVATGPIGPDATKPRDAQFLRQVILDLARIYRWMAYHRALSKWSERGWPEELRQIREQSLRLGCTTAAAW